MWKVLDTRLFYKDSDKRTCPWIFTIFLYSTPFSVNFLYPSRILIASVKWTPCKRWLGWLLSLMEWYVISICKHDYVYFYFLGGVSLASLSLWLVTKNSLSRLKYAYCKFNFFPFVAHIISVYFKSPQLASDLWTGDGWWWSTLQNMVRYKTEFDYEHNRNANSVALFRNIETISSSLT